MDRSYTIDDVVAEQRAAPPGASVRDLRAGAWIDERGAVTVRNPASEGDLCEQCGNEVAVELKREFRTYTPGTNGAHWHPDGQSVVECFDTFQCEQRQAARDVWANRFPTHIVDPARLYPSYWEWGPGTNYGAVLMLDEWFPDAERSLALAGRAIGIWANGETVAEITPEAVAWDRPHEVFGARCEYVDMFASAGHGLALVDVALRRGSGGEVLTLGTAYRFAEKLDLATYHGDKFWDHPIQGAVQDAIGPIIVTDPESWTPTQLLLSVADAIDQANCHVNREAATEIRRRFDIPRAAPVDWRVGLKPSTDQEAPPESETPL